MIKYLDMWEKLTIAEKILIGMNKGLKVSRHTVLRNKYAIRLYLQQDQYKHLREEIEFLIDSAKESA